MDAIWWIGLVCSALAVVISAATLLVTRKKAPARDHTAETLERCTKACADCAVMLGVYQDHARQLEAECETIRADLRKISDVLSRNGSGKVSDADGMSEIHEIYHAGCIQ
jgi:hypothetical protein